MFAFLMMLFLFLLHCCVAVEVDYPPCGSYHDDPPFDSRPQPEHYEDQGLAWILYRRNLADPVEIVIEDTAIKVPPEYDPDLSTKVLIHGYNANLSKFQDIKDEYLLMEDVNVIIVDWEAGADGLNYLQAASNTQVVGGCSAFVAQELGGGGGAGGGGLFHCTGHSLGGQACGYMGKRMMTGELDRITALDPAGPMFETFGETVRVDKSDASFVDIIHTQARQDPTLVNYGMRLAAGHVDFYPNKAAQQPGCTTLGCDHDICMDYFLASIASPSCFPAYPCDSDEDADSGLCDDCDMMDSCQWMGEPASHFLGNGTFFLATTDDYPHCMYND